MRRPRSASGALAATAAALAVVVLAGCASSADLTGTSSVGSAAAPAAPPISAAVATGSPPPVAAHAAATVAGVRVDCPDGAPFADTRAGESAPPALTKDAAISAVVRCQTVQRAYPGLGEWTVQLAEVADAGFEPFLAELRKPSAPLTSGPCLDYLRLTPWFALVEAAGSDGGLLQPGVLRPGVLRPGVPKDECGQVSSRAIAALGALDFRLVDAVRVRQVSSPQAVESGCAQRWKDLVALEGVTQSGRTDGGGVADLASSPSSVLVCLYRAGAPEGGVRAGELIKGVTVAGEQAARLASGAQVARPLPGGCADAGTFSVLHTPHGEAYVEVGGCDRVLTNDGRLGAASPELVADVAAALG